ncbi:hypothetical protein NPIL_430141 [Nephila pilipes]|uniref:Uncharacterized protein n=1 Tax=Nephila pilipes TaxID=299642 RepID=A0A8X6NSC0_NEPPI|nr:hypothetical protein NPIL_430141 [Nephila pilipes]
MVTEDNKRNLVEAAPQIFSGLQNLWQPGIPGLFCHRRRDLVSLHYTGNGRTIPSVETSKIAEAAEVQTNTVCRQRDGERLLEQEGVIVVRFNACRYNNQCGMLM